ncbi:unnamed protein product [Choristocarpus tenellus]
MVLLTDRHVPCTNVGDFDPLSSELVETAERFCTTSTCVQENTIEVLRVLQGEVAMAMPGDGPESLGSDCATTCHIVAMRNPSSGQSCLAHLDSASRVTECVNRMNTLMDAPVPQDSSTNATGGYPSLDLYVVGGYLGEPEAEELTTCLFDALASSSREFHVVLACIGQLNSCPLLDGGLESLPRRGKGDCGSQEQSDIMGRCVGSDGQASVLRAALSAEGPCGSWKPVRTSLAIRLGNGTPFPVQFVGAGTRGEGWEVRQARLVTRERSALTEVCTSRRVFFMKI